MRPSLIPAATVALALTLGSAQGAAAQVLEIGDGGAVTVRAGPAVTTDAGVTSLLAPAPTASVDAEIAEAARLQRVDPRLVRAVAVQESRLNPAARSPRGAVGVMQLMPATAAALGVDAADLHGNIMGGAAYLHRMLDRFGGDVRLALAAYNAGPGAVERHGGLPPFAETQAYVRDVMRRAAALPAVPFGAVP